MGKKAKARAAGEGSLYEIERRKQLADGSVATYKVYVAEIEWTDPQTRERRTLKAQRVNKADAVAVLNEFRTQARAGSAPAVARDDRSVNEVFAAYFDDVALRVQPGTIAGYRVIVGEHLLPFLGGRRAMSVTRSDIVRWLKARKEAGVGDRLLQVAYQRAKAALGPFVAHLPPHEHPFPTAGAPKVREEEMTVWTESEVRTFIATSATVPRFAIYIVAVTSGLRQGELLALRWSDVDLETGRLHVRRARGRTAGEMKDPKTRASVRDVVLPPDGIAALKLWRDDPKRKSRKTGPRDRIFTMSPSAAYKGIERAAAAAGVTQISFHEQRHTFATLLLGAGIDVKTVAALMGHSDATMVLRRYGHFIRGSEEKAAGVLAGLLSVSRPVSRAKVSSRAPRADKRAQARA